MIKNQDSTILRIISYAFNHKKKLFITAASVVISTLLALVPPLFIRKGIDVYIAQGELTKLFIAAALMVILILIKGIFDFIKSYFAEYIAQNIIHDLRVELYQHLNSLSFSFFDSSETGDLMSRLTADADTLRKFINRGSTFITANILTIAAIFLISYSWDYRLGIIYLLMLPLMILGIIIYARRVRPMFKKVRKSFARLTGMIRESFVGIEVIKLFGRENYEFEKFKKENQKYLNINLEAAKVSAFWMPYVNFFMGLGTAAVIWYGGRLVIYDQISLGILAAFISYISMLLRPVRQTGMLISFGSQAAAAAERIFEVLDRESDLKEAKNPLELDKITGDVEYKDLSFSYQKGKEVLKNINLKVKEKETVAVVGPTGAGKTTLLHLLPRFYDPDQGKILIDGHDIKELKLDSLRREIGIVMQQSFLFAASIRENISYGKPDASFEDIKKAAQVAQIDEFIESLPLGYETPVGERGVSLSGGQKQRLAIARVLLTQPSLLILDEPTSSIDAATESKLNQALKEVLANRTSFIIAHRLWTVKIADRIIVIKDGEIIESGSYQELKAKDSYFNSLESSLKRNSENIVKKQNAKESGDGR
ncbi:ABC transporter ATP-binding protein/permease [Halanaerobium sp. Z-7514]|uniref:ABC transporter ATP-binding protein/permease n=1 Tax=Halanaerobium polyolivorans TaxID=2886943 RepID=A0AAW4WZL2_9FIRM|nr:ABC transporter ATP-binding protein [Halanaerobium polyolivorans]MCC3145129.1 ABC transporter ATP-binding protein/permease [Halanaerobium polyolivorans]